MRLPTYKYTSQVSQGGAMRQPIHQDQPTLERALQRNVQNYLRDPRAGQRNLRAEAAAVDYTQVASALGTSLVKLGTAMEAADAASQYNSNWGKFNLELGTELIRTREKDLVVKNEDYGVPGQKTSKQEFFPTHDTLVPTFRDAAYAKRDAYAAGMTNKKARARFLSSANTKIKEHLMTVSGWARDAHQKWLIGEKMDQLAMAQTFEEVDRILGEEDTYLAWTPDKVSEHRRIHYRRIATDQLEAKLIGAWYSRRRLNELQGRIQHHGLLGIVYNDDGSIREKNVLTDEFDEIWQYIDDGDELKFIEKIDDRLKVLNKELDERRQRDSDNEILKMFQLGDDNELSYTEADLEEWIVNNPFATGSQISQMRSILASIKQGPLAPNHEEEAEIRSDLASWSVAEIAQNSLLTPAQKTRLFTRKETVALGGALWDDENNPYGPWGARALAKIKRDLKVDLDPNDPAWWAPGAEGDALRAARQMAKDWHSELELYLLNEDPDAGPVFSDQQKPRAAWDWTLKKFKDRKDDLAAAAAAPDIAAANLAAAKKRSHENFLQWRAMEGNRKPDGTVWLSVEEVLELPAGPAKRALVFNMMGWGVDVDSGSEEGRDLETWLLEGDGTIEEWFRNLKNKIGFN